jgi:NAD(P)-dependent dehydrogenase (short-subunit alcohol dehydrogenase family)
MTLQKVWLVTEASSGLGRALTEEILRAGDLLVATARNTAELEPLASQFRNEMRAVALDVLNSKDMKVALSAALESFGRIDVLVNNASYGAIDTIRTITAAEFRRHIDTNFWGVVHATRSALPVMRAQGFGHILQITSVYGCIGTPDRAGYLAVKSAIERLSESLAFEVRMSGIHVGVVEVGSLRLTRSSQAGEDSVETFNKSTHILRRLSRTIYCVPGDPVGAALAILDLTKENLHVPRSVEAPSSTDSSRDRSYRSRGCRRHSCAP